MKNIKKYSPPIPHLLQAQQALALPYAKVAGTENPAPPRKSLDLIHMVVRGLLKEHYCKAFYT